MLKKIHMAPDTVYLFTVIHSITSPMKKKLIRKIIYWSGGIFLLLFAVLLVHIYMVTRPKAPDASTRIMARIDIRQDINANQADSIKAWLYQQKGIDHVLCNPQSDIVVFTYAPVQTNAELILYKLQTAFSLPAQRVTATAEEISKGCPVSANSTTYRVMNYLKKHI
jgi:hypothetical protein